MNSRPDAEGSTGQSRARIVGAAVLIVAIAAILIVTQVAPSESPSQPAPSPTPLTSTAALSPQAPPELHSPHETDPRRAAEHELATRPMLALPAQAAQPQPRTSDTAGPPLAIPQAGPAHGRWIPDIFPRTPEGALAQLKILNESALAAADGQLYDRAYRQMSLPGAPDPDRTGLHRMLMSLRSAANVPVGGPVTDLQGTYEITHGQIKGTAGGGNFVVACVLGTLSLHHQGRTVTAGAGDCQAMRWTGLSWRIAPGPLAADAPNAWPGSFDSVRAGYRALATA